MRLFFAAKFWLPITFVTTILCGLIYLSVQQNFRMSANDPQIQMAEDAALLLNTGVRPESVVGNITVDMAKSLAPYLIVYNTHGEVVTSGAIMHNIIPVVPFGVLQNAKENTQSRLTWQPEVGVREAIVVVPFNNGYVLAGRSLQEVEKRENSLLLYTSMAWVTAVVGSLGIIVIFSFFSPHVKKK